MSDPVEQMKEIAARDRRRLETELRALGVGNPARLVAAIDDLVRSEVALAFARFAANMKSGR